jgi:hypothetical protein
MLRSVVFVVLLSGLSAAAGRPCDDGTYSFNGMMRSTIDDYDKMVRKLPKDNNGPSGCRIFWKPTDFPSRFAQRTEDGSFRAFTQLYRAYEVASMTATKPPRRGVSHRFNRHAGKGWVYWHTRTQLAQLRQLAAQMQVCPPEQPPSAEHLSTQTGALVFRYTQLWLEELHGHCGPSAHAQSRASASQTLISSAREPPPRSARPSWALPH